MQPPLRLILVGTHWGVLIVVLLALLYFCMAQCAHLLALCPAEQESGQFEWLIEAKALMRFIFTVERFLILQKKKRSRV